MDDCSALWGAFKISTHESDSHTKSTPVVNMQLITLLQGGIPAIYSLVCRVSQLTFGLGKYKILQCLQPY